MRGFISFLIGLFVSISVFSQNLQPEISIHETEATNVVYVQNLSNMVLFPVFEDAFFVGERGTGNTYIFNQKGEQLSKLNLSSNSYFSDRNPLVFSNNRALVQFADGIIAIINPKGEVLYDLDKIKDLNKDSIPLQFKDGLSIIQISTPVVKHERVGKRTVIPYETYIDSYHFFDDNGKMIGIDFVLNNNSAVYPLKDGRRLYYDGKTEKYGYLDEGHKIVIPFQYVKAADFSEGLAAVAIRRGDELLWGFIDTEGNWVIEPKFSTQPDDFHEGYAIAKKKNDRYVYFDKTGQVCSEEFIEALRFLNGQAMVRIKSDDFWDVGRRFINKSFDFTPYKGPSVPSNSTLIFCEKTNTYFYKQQGAVYSANGELLFKSTAPFYSDVTVYYENRRPKGYVNMKGEIVIKFVESEF